jgi:hypothetical protein
MDGQEGKEGRYGWARPRKKRQEGQEGVEEEEKVKLEDYRQAFYRYSTRASEGSRQLAFAGIAIIWLFKRDTAGQLSIPHDLVLPGIFIVVSLALDMIHYCLGTIIWRWYYRKKEDDGIDESTELPKHSLGLEIPIYVVFWAKIVVLLLAYAGIFCFLWTAISFK